ncbi:MAG: hypothetical protein KA436_00055 [Oligoflexales bacterium]|nr:hypothetical protein [Oligoflexales bacterium]
MYQVMIQSPDGEEIELVAAEEKPFSTGAKIGAEALLHLLTDEVDLEEGYSIVVKQDGVICEL